MTTGKTTSQRTDRHMDHGRMIAVGCGETMDLADLLDERLCAGRQHLGANPLH